VNVYKRRAKQLSAYGSQSTSSIIPLTTTDSFIKGKETPYIRFLYKPTGKVSLLSYNSFYAYQSGPYPGKAQSISAYGTGLKK